MAGCGNGLHVGSGGVVTGAPRWAARSTSGWEISPTIRGISPTRRDETESRKAWNRCTIEPKQRGWLVRKTALSAHLIESDGITLDSASGFPAVPVQDRNAACLKITGRTLELIGWGDVGLGKVAPSVPRTPYYPSEAAYSPLRGGQFISL